MAVALAAMVILFAGICMLPKIKRIPGKVMRKIETQTYKEPSREELLEYCESKGFNTDYYILVDFTKKSSEKRFTVRRFSDGSVVFSSLCAHGDGKPSTTSKPHFSNRPGSCCTSLGRFRIGKVVTTSQGWTALKLYGLGWTNFNASRRGILVHGSKTVSRNPKGKLLPLGKKVSEGCFTISHEAFASLKKLAKDNPDIVICAFSEKS